LWDALFPRPYAQELKPVAASEQLPEEFIYSIMRKESAYDASVVSSADAIGLLQLIEPTAKTMARMCSMPSFKRAQLYDPAINIRLGARYLAFLRDRYAGQYVPAIAAYNAGEHRIGAWLARAAERDPKKIELDRWVEDIPIEQTRNYVRRVIANWARYRYLENPAQPWPIELPELLTK
jgi:soluble lytic murein transglycosylase